MLAIAGAEASAIAMSRITATGIESGKRRLTRRRRGYAAGATLSTRFRLYSPEPPH
jgi:hypothetical protein